ncbi:hypothetical protein N7486_004720 [Penicillium sp. IBT 16267x]|nr:hypothetical protein N7486_004720 [Penicillium sp. IBT 16267x]
MYKQKRDREICHFINGVICMNARFNKINRNKTKIYGPYTSLLERNYYENICVREGPFHNHPLDRLKRTLRDEPNLQKFIISAVIPYTTSLYDFFFTLSILRFNAMDPLEDESGLRQFIGRSPVTALNLIRYGAHKEALATILSWPAALEVLHYDVEQAEWGGFYDKHAKSWTYAAFVRTLQPQMGSLKELTLTRPWLKHEGFLEELEIFYDDWDLTTFEEDEFLWGLLVHKEEHLPHLRRIIIASPEII